MKKYTISFLLFIGSYGLVSAQTLVARDFLVQDVCLDSTGNVLTLSPIDSACASTRNLQPHEKLPYHKHDQRGNDLNPAAVNGYQRSDSFPSGDANSVVQTLDFGVGGKVFGLRDQGDGFNVYETRGDYASIVATDDATGGLQYFLAPPCNAKATGFVDINDSWVLAPTAPTVGVTGNITTSLMIAKTPSTCPTRYDQSLTLWDLPASKLGYTGGQLLETLISYHYSHPSVAGSDHLEKFFFTKELGGTRWERWERPNTPYHTLEKERSLAKAATQTCNGPSESQDVIGFWYRVDCREWTNIVPVAASSSFDIPTDWSVVVGTSTIGYPTVSSNNNSLISVVAPNSKKVKIGSFVVQTPAGSSFTLKTIQVNAVAADYPQSTISNVYIVRNGNTMTPTVSGGSMFNFTDSFKTINTRTYDVYADIGAALSGSVTTNISATLTAPKASSFNRITTATLTSINGATIMSSPFATTNNDRVFFAETEGFVKGVKDIVKHGLWVISGAATLTTASAASSCVSIPTNLHRGSALPSVDKLQKFLNQKGLLQASSTGFFGDKTIEAVKAYQRSVGLKETGMVYDFTRRAISDETCQ